MIVAMVMGAAMSLSGDAARAETPSPESISNVSRYCHACWRNARIPADRWSDCTQDVLTRLLQRVDASRWSGMMNAESPDHREFIRAIDAVKKRAQRARQNARLVDEAQDSRGAREVARNDLRDQLSDAARMVLNPRQRRIVQLTCDGWSIPEIANELATSVERVSDEKYKAIRKLRRHFLPTDAA